MSSGHEGTTSEKQPSFRRGLFSTSFGTVLGLLFLFGETAIAARVLAKEELGVYVILVIATMFLLIVADFGCKTAITKFIAGNEPEKQAAYTHSVLLFRFAVVIVLSALVLLIPQLMLVFDPEGTTLSYAAYIPLMLITASFDELLLSMLQGFHAYRNMAIMQIVRSTLRITLSSLFLIVWPMGVTALVISWIVSYGLAAIYAFLVLPISKRPVYRQSLVVELLRFGFPIHMNRFVSYAFHRVDLLLLSVLAGPAAVASYNIATRIPDALQRLTESFTQVYFPTVSSLLAKNEHEEAGRMLSTSIRLLSAVIATGTLFTIVFSTEIVRLLFSEKYLDITIALGVFTLVFHIMFITTLMGYTITAAGYPARPLRASVTRTVLNAIGDVLLIPIFSFTGTAYATLAAAYATHPIVLWLLGRSGVKADISPYMKQTALLLLLAGLFWWLQPAAILIKALFVVVFAVLIVVLGTVSYDDLQLVVPRRMLVRLRVAKNYN